MQMKSSEGTEFTHRMPARRTFIVAAAIVLAACGSSSDDVQRKVERTAESCIRVGQALSSEVIACLRSAQNDAPMRGNPTGPGSPMRRCETARGTIGMFCADLNIEIDSEGLVRGWSVSVLQQE